MASVKLSGVSKQYGDMQVIHDVDLAVPSGEFIVFVGPSGCGKSSLLRMIAGLEELSAGEVSIGERRVNELLPAERGVAMVFQNYALYPHMTVAENMGFALRIGGLPRAEIAAAVEHAASMLHIGHLLDRRPKALSGGERQRVAIGRAIVRQPEVFLFDEPLSNLDASLRVTMRLELMRLHRQLRSTMIYVTHDQVEAMTMGERIVVFNQGRIEQVGTPLELYQQPVNQFVAGFLGTPQINFLPCTVASEPPEGVCLKLERGGALAIDGVRLGCGVGQRVVLGIRPEHLMLKGVGAGLPARVEHFEHLGDAVILYASLGGDAQLVAVRLDGEEAPQSPGELIHLWAHPRHCLLFDARGRAMVPLADHGRRPVAA